MIERTLNRQPYVKLSSELRETSDVNTKALSKNSCDTTTDVLKKKEFDAAPRHDLKIIIAKKSSGKGISRNIGFGTNKIKLNKPNGNSSKVLSDFERLRGDVDNVQFSSASSSEIVSTSEMKTTLSKKSGTVSHHDLKLENKSSTKKHNSASHDYYESTTAIERAKEKSYAEKSKRESTKHAKNNEKMERLKAKSKSNLSLNNIPKLKIELPSLKTKITVPKTPTDTYVISSKSPSNSPKGETLSKKVRFDISTSKERCYDFNDDSDLSFVDQMKYAERIGLKPVERKVESIILHRKRKKSKHSKEPEHSKRPKLHVSSSLDESLKLKLKIMGGKASKKSNEEEAHHEKTTCNLRAVQCKTADLTSINVQEEKQKNIREKQKEADEAVVGLENHKYSVTEQKNAKSGSDQPMVFIPKLVLQKSLSMSASHDKKDSSETFAIQQRRNSYVVEQSKPTSTDGNESIKLKVRSFESIAATDFANQTQTLMKPPTAKMGSPKQSHMTTTFSLSPIRPHSIPASLKLSPISQPNKNDFQAQNHNLIKRSLSLGAEKTSPSYLNAFIQPNKNLFPSTSSPDTINIQYSKIPPLIQSSSSTFKNFYGSMNNTTNNKSQSPQHASKLPNINVKDPIKLFPNACPSVEILKIPQKTFSPLASNIKLNRPLMQTTIPLERIRKSAQNPVAQKILPKPQLSQNVLKAAGFHQSPQCSSQTLNYSGIYQTPISRDVSLERYTLELTHDIAKLDRSLSLEKNFEDWEKRKLQEYSKMNELKVFPSTARNLLHQQQNLSVRNVPNPSALMMSRNQTLSNNSVAIKAANMSPNKETVTSTNSEQSDIEEILSKSMIAKAASERQLSDCSPQKSPGSKVNDKKSIEKLTEYLRLTAAKSKDAKHDDDNNNNNNSSTNNCDESAANKNNRSFNLVENKSGKFMNVNMPSVDVICIDS